MKGFVEEWGQSSNHRSDGKERIASCHLLHLKSNSRINVNLKSSKQPALNLALRIRSSALIPKTPTTYVLLSLRERIEVRVC